MAQAIPTPYPVTIRGDLSEPINRWLFLIKWLLLIPHAVVLVFLFIGLFVAWVIALFAILFTGKYPRSLFDFNVGVMRWGWRVGFYSYSALGTDQYPPFSLAKKDDYPADLDVEYPETLSRGLVLVKWWLLAFPHFVIVNILTDTLLPFLVLILAVVNLFTSRYHRDVWEFVMGINRWNLRMIGYVLLTTDQYPPFHFRE